MQLVAQKKNSFCILNSYTNLICILWSQYMTDQGCIFFCLPFWEIRGKKMKSEGKRGKRRKKKDFFFFNWKVKKLLVWLLIQSSGGVFYWCWKPKFFYYRNIRIGFMPSAGFPHDTLGTGWRIRAQIRLRTRSSTELIATSPLSSGRGRTRSSETKL